MKKGILDLRSGLNKVKMVVHYQTLKMNQVMNINKFSLVVKRQNKEDGLSYSLMVLVRCYENLQINKKIGSKFGKDWYSHLQNHLNDKSAKTIILS